MDIGKLLAVVAILIGAVMLIGFVLWLRAWLDDQ